MPAALQLQWEFAPATLFEEDLATEFAECKVSVGKGTVVATLPMQDGNTRSELRQAVEAYVESLLLGAQLASHSLCKLNSPTVSVLREDGTKNYILECESGRFEIRGGQVDIRYTKSDGTVVDTRQERVSRKHRLSLAAATYAPKDAALARMLRSYRSAISDAQDELVHLYEVLDALSSTFGSQDEARRQLGQPKKTWSRLGELCNALPLSQGRHRGRGLQELRSASPEELVEARSLSSELIESYIKYLERAEG
jgi:hypothetical protein